VTPLAARSVNADVVGERRPTLKFRKVEGAERERLLKSRQTSANDHRSYADMLAGVRDGEVVTLTVDGATRQRGEKLRLSRAARELGKSLVWLTAPNPRQIAFQVRTLSSLQRALVVTSSRDTAVETLEPPQPVTALPGDPFERVVVMHGELGQEIIQLGCSLYMPEGFRRFIMIPMPELGGRSTLETLDSGEADAVLAVLQSLAERRPF
jgi:hypothetical protein